MNNEQTNLKLGAPKPTTSVDFIAALKIADAAMKSYADAHPNWWKRLDGTPIPNDLGVHVAQAIEAAGLVAAQAESVLWQPIETAPRDRKVRVAYKNSMGNWRTVMASYYLANTLESDITESGYADEGWYEECESADEIMPVDCAPTHWMLLSAPPSDNHHSTLLHDPSAASVEVPNNAIVVAPHKDDEGQVMDLSSETTYPKRKGNEKTNGWKISVVGSAMAREAGKNLPNSNAEFLAAYKAVEADIQSSAIAASTLDSHRSRSLTDIEPTQANTLPLLGEDGRMSSEMRDAIEGMSVSLDVSTGENDVGARYFGTVSEVMDDLNDKHGVTLLVQDAESNQKVQSMQIEPNMFWNNADPEHSASSIHQVIDREWESGMIENGSTMEIQRAIRLPNIKIRITLTSEYEFEYDVIDENITKKQL